MNNLKTVICEDDHILAEELQQMITRRVPDMNVVQVTHSGTDCLDAIKDYGARVLLLDTTLIGDDVRRITAEAMKAEPMLLVFWLSDYLDLNITNSARTVGVKTVLQKPVRADELQAAVRQALEEESKLAAELASYQARQSTNRLGEQVYDQGQLATRMAGSVVKQEKICVYSPKGGVGKTAMAAHLAAGLASTPVMKFKVVLLDLDLQWPNIKTVAGNQLTPPPGQPLQTITSIVDRGLEHELTREILDQFLMVHSSGLRVLLGPPSPLEAAKVTDTLVENIIDILSQDYDFVVMDTQQDLTNTTLVALEKASKIVVPITIDSHAIADVIKWIDLMKEADMDWAKAKMVLTRIEKNNDFSYKEVSDVIPIPIIGRIPDDRKARSTMNNAELVDLFRVHTPFTEAMKQVGQQLVPVFSVGGRKRQAGPKGKVQAPKAPRQSGQRESLIGKLFRRRA